MKDLYARFKIDREASTAVLSGKLKDLSEAKPYAPVLLNEEKRALYDRTHATLKAIGLLRHRLGLDSDSSWFVENCPDFSVGFGPSMSVPAAGESAAAQPPRPPSREASPASPPPPVTRSAPRKLSPLLLALVIVLLIIVALALL